MSGVTYDAGALIAAERRDRAFWAIHATLLARGARATVPAGVLAQVWRGGRQASITRVLKGCVVEPLDETGARAVGVACGLAGVADTVDVAVVVGALRRGDAVVTSDASDVRRIAEALGRELVVERV